MRLVSSFVLVFAVIIGLQARVLAKDPCEVIASMHQVDPCDHPHEESLPCDPSHEKNCPAEHHHHGCVVCHVSPLASEDDFASRLELPTSIRLRLWPESELIPEGPYLSSDRPPII
jgi:hypothetical protein